MKGLEKIRLHRSSRLYGEVATGMIKTKKFPGGVAWCKNSTSGVDSLARTANSTAW